MNENYKKMSKSDIREIRAGLKKYAAIERRYDCMGVQSKRFFQDSVIADAVGAEYVNTNNTGWDGCFEGGYPFENKNVTVHAKTNKSFSLVFQDTSREKLEEIKKGVICTTTFWDDSRNPAFLVVGNTKTVSDLLEKSWSQTSVRKTCSVTLPNCLKNGFKIVAMDYDKEEVMAVISKMFPRLAKNLLFTDIYTEDDLAGLVAGMK